jgi:hypothetical protein
MDFSRLSPGQRYLFHYKRNNGTNEYGTNEYFRANFLGVRMYKEYSTLVVNNYDTNVWAMTPAEIWYMDLKSITKVETLADILGSGSGNNTRVLPDDVLLYIDNYL